MDIIYGALNSNLNLMKFIIIILCIGISVAARGQSDSLRVFEIPEIIVSAEKQTETPTHTVIVPTSTERTHSANAFDLVHAMNLSGLDISYDSKQIFTSLGKEVVLCIDGVEVSTDEIIALRSKNIQSIEFQRNPTGKYQGKGGVLNFKTIQYAYGGNVYVSAKESFLYNHGEYLASADYVKKKSRWSLVYSNDWGIARNKQKIDNQYLFANGDILAQNSETEHWKNKNIVNALNLRYTNTGEKYRFSVLGTFSDIHTPYENKSRLTEYTGILQQSSTTQNAYDAYSNAFSTKINYTLWLPKKQIFDVTASVAMGKNNYNYNYQETGQEKIHSEAKENNMYLSATVQYFKTLKNGMDFSTVIDHYYTRFKDCYGGSISDNQFLENHVSMATLGLSKSFSNLYFYVTAGVSNMYTYLNNKHYNYFNPTGYYGLNYSPKSEMSFTWNGFYVHTLFDASYKNNVSIPTSFFEVTKGNPNLTPIKVLSNTFEYNYHWQRTSLTASYMCYIYFDNILHTYETDNNKIYTSLSNDGNFYGNMLTVTLAQKMFNDKLNVSLKCIEEYNVINGELYHKSHNVIRGKLKIDYTIKKGRVGLELSTPYKALDIREPCHVKEPMKMSLYTAWDWSNLRLEASINNPFTKYAESKRYMEYPCFNMNIKDFDNKLGRSLAIKVTYNFGYGKKVERSNNTVEKYTNSAIMKPY